MTTDTETVAYVRGVRVWSSARAFLDSEPFLVLLPGFGAGLEFMIPLARQLSRQYQVAVLDLPGFGLTRRRGIKSIEHMAEALCGVVDELTSRSVVIIAQSAASMIALRMAGRWSERQSKCRGLCLLGGAQRRTVYWVKRPGITLIRHPLDFLLALWTVLAAALRLPQTIRRTALRSRMIRLALLWPYMERPGAGDPSQLDDLLKNSGSIHAFGFARQLRSFDIDAAVRQASVPMALLTGQRDRYVAVADRRFYRDVAQVERDDIAPGSGHWVTVEAFNDTVAWVSTAISELTKR